MYPCIRPSRASAFLFLASMPSTIVITVKCFYKRLLVRARCTHCQTRGVGPCAYPTAFTTSSFLLNISSSDDCLHSSALRAPQPLGTQQGFHIIFVIFIGICARMHERVAGRIMPPPPCTRLAGPARARPRLKATTGASEKHVWLLA